MPVLLTRARSVFDLWLAGTPCRGCHQILGGTSSACKEPQYLVPCETVDTKSCSKCGVEKSLGEFYWDKKKARPYSACKVCHRQFIRAWQLRNPEKVRVYGQSTYRKHG